jgi:predicted TIM-barrel fold metal-dependent hydrolase
MQLEEVQAMRCEDLVLVSVDDHVIEPPGMFDAHVPAAYREHAPGLVEQPDGTIRWQFQGITVPTLALNAVVGRDPSEIGYEPVSYQEIRSGCFDVDERVKDMNAAGVLGSMCFPSFPGFAGGLFNAAPDKAISAVMVRAYNDWVVDEWCGAYPHRLIPLAIGPLWDVETLVAEVHRVAEKGCHAITFSENPSRIGRPSLHDPYWNPFWAACCDEGTVPCIHLGSSSEMTITSMDAPVDVVTTLAPFGVMKCATDLIWARMFRDYPSLRIALSEGGIGWIPYLLDRVDRVYDRHRHWTGQDFGDQLPSDVFRDHVLTCFIADPVGLGDRYRIGVRGMMWESDYPHGDSVWPRCPEVFLQDAAELSRDEIDLITHGNAMRNFRFDPFSTLAPDAGSVGALRALAGDVETGDRTIGIKRGSQGQTMAEVLKHVGSDADPSPDGEVRIV